MRLTPLHLFILLPSILLFGCSSDSDSDSDSESDSGGNNTGNQNASYPLNAPVLNDLFGTWDDSVTYSEGTDEIYFVIKEGDNGNGELVIYDYLGDPIDDDENCYFVIPDLTLEDTGSGQFKLQREMYESEGESLMQFTMPNIDQISVTMVRDYYTESDWVMPGDYTVTYELIDTQSATLTFMNNQGTSILTADATGVDSYDYVIWEVTDSDIAPAHSDYAEDMEWEFNYFDYRAQINDRHSQSEEQLTPTCSTSDSNNSTVAKSSSYSVKLKQMSNPLYGKKKARDKYAK